MMGSPQNLAFLRPYTTCALKVRTPAYARFYSVTNCHHQTDEDGFPIMRMSYSIPSPNAKGPPCLPQNVLADATSGADNRSKVPIHFYPVGAGDSTNDTIVAGKEPQPIGVGCANDDPMSHFDNLGAGIMDRIDKLSTARALKYPRMKAAVLGRPHIRIPVFVQKYRRVKHLGSVSSEGESVLSGRVRTVRRSGAKLAFIEITQEHQTVQVMLHWNATMVSRSRRMNDDEHFRQFRHILGLIRRGDIISVPGVPNRDKWEQIGLAATDLPTILTPAIADIPESLNEVRLGNRHTDLIVNPVSSGTILLRSHLLNVLRTVFANQGFLEVSTPILASNASGAVAAPFQTHLQSDQPGKPLALRIAPELWLKRLVVGGFDRVYEIGPAFRNEGQDLSHNPEFTMCEFYQTYATLNDLITWTCKTFYELSRALTAALAPYPQTCMPSKAVLKAFGEGSRTYKFPQVQYLPQLEKKLKIKFRDLGLHQPGGKDRLVQALLGHQGLCEGKLKAAKDMSKIFDILSEQYLEKMLPGQPFFVTHQPAFMSPLSKWTVCPETRMPVAARAELFYNGIEIANMYEEENSPFEQRLKLLGRLGGGDDLSAWSAGEDTDLDAGIPRNHWPNNLGGSDADDAFSATMMRENPNREGVSAGRSGGNYGARRMKGEAEFVDEQYVETLLTGMPPTGGWGCGIDRLVMLFSGSHSISSTLSFGSVRHVRAVAERSRILASGGK